ncbi:haloacid dehalogenase [Laetiporus sulphureus 93-53]|uniref:Haloacid dehalogenase n=1 Tax=Laetiporus sulphureus 93-53 TaxID=1314785 RepID=A0A165BEH8_9APHY|nr:haloacid dehalogenase [Laetiporus sulphureus 93-53]KZT00881.1 haloacid dehalogenase [Laetiporus sulphureus 93-53]
MPPNPLRGVQAFVFDVFGTVVDWRSSVAAELGRHAKDGVDGNWEAFAEEWRQGYYRLTGQVARGGPGPSNVDEMHRQILDSMLQTPRWAHLAPLWDGVERAELVMAWHRTKGWPDTTAGLYALKKHAIIGTLSNGNVRLLVDMAKYADLPWDVIFSGELLGSYKPNPKMYLGALHHLSLEPHQCAMVAAHIYDLRAAASHGMKTVFVRRPREPDSPPDVRTKAEGGEVDVVAGSFTEVADILAEARKEEADKQVWQ